MNMMQWYLNAQLILIQYLIVSSEAAVMLNSKVVTGTVTSTTTSACICKNRCLVSLTCTIASWFKKAEDSYECHSTIETQVDFEDDLGWNTYCKKNCALYIINRDCVTATGQVVLDGTTNYQSDLPGCKKYSCFNTILTDTTSSVYEFVPMDRYTFDAGLGCVSHYSDQTYSYTNAKIKCSADKAMLVDIDLVNGAAHLKSYTETKGLTANELWIGTIRKILEGPWVQSFGSTFTSSSSLWKPTKPNQNYYLYICVAAIKDSNYLLDDKPCIESKVIICEMKPKTVK